MSIRYLDVKVRIDFGEGLSDEDRAEIADAVRSDIDYSLRNGVSDCDHEAKDWTTGAEWSAQSLGRGC